MKLQTISDDQSLAAKEMTRLIFLENPSTQFIFFDLWLDQTAIYRSISYIGWSLQNEFFSFKREK